MKKTNEKIRLDVLLVEKGYFPSREKAKTSIMAGIVYVDNLKVDKAGTLVNCKSEIYIKEDLCPYVSRGGLKLEKAINLWKISLKNRICTDMGASTGGFTDCMLRNGANKVYAIDVGYGQLDYSLRTDNRVINLERTNIRYLDTSLILEPIDFISIDVSFISLRLILPVAGKILSEKGLIVCLVKPQFEAGRQQIGKKGIVRDTLYPAGLTYSPVTGTKGNIEYLLLLGKSEKIFNKSMVKDVVEKAHEELYNGCKCFKR